MRSIVYEINSDSCLLKITKDEKGFHVICGVETMGWAEVGKETLEETIKDLEKQVCKYLKNLDKTNKGSRKGLNFILIELRKHRQLEFKL